MNKNENDPNTSIQEGTPTRWEEAAPASASMEAGV
jgi:hypothetical protein